MKVVGIDQSLNGTGYAYRDGADVMTDRISVKTLKGIPRLAYVKRRITEVLDYAQPSLVVLEDYAMGIGKGGRTYHIGELGGVLKILCWERGIDVMIVNIKTVKELIAGHGGADKPEMVAAAANRFGIAVDAHDEADACGLMLVGEARVFGQGPADFKKQVQACKKGITFTRGFLQLKT